MKKNSLLTLTLVLAIFSTFGISSMQVAQGDTLSSFQNGDWNDDDTWMVTWTRPGDDVDPDGIPDSDDKAEINHAITVTNGQSVAVLEYIANGSITGSGSGLLTVTGSLTTRNDVGGSGVKSFTTDNTYFNLSGANGMTTWNDITWTHNGNLDWATGGYDWHIRGLNTFITVAGTGLLEVDQLRLNSTFLTPKNNLTIDRNLTASAITSESVQSTLNLASGITTTDGLFTLGTGLNEGVINFTAANFSTIDNLLNGGFGTGPILGVLSTDLSFTAANDAITDGYITKTTSRPFYTFEYGGYTYVTVIPEPSTAVILLVSGLLAFRRRK